VDEFVVFDRGKKGRSVRALSAGLSGIRSAAGTLREIASRLPEGRFDLLLDLQVYLKAGLLTALVPANVKLGFDRRRSRDLNRLFVTHCIPPNPVGFAHIQDQYFEFLHFIGVNPEPVDYGLCLSDEERSSQRAFFSTLDLPGIAVVVGSSDPRKNWTPEGLAEVASRARSQFGLQPVLIGRDSREEERIASEVASRTKGGVIDARGGGLRRLLWLLDGCVLAISPDTGPLHMARAVECPVVGLFGFTNPKRSGPYRRFTDLVVDGYARSPGEAYEINMEKRKGGMGRITPEMVMEKVALALRHRSASG
jgi:heptosyltransferase I